jgi:signal peptide peptidase SppA
MKHYQYILQGYEQPGSYPATLSAPLKTYLSQFQNSEDDQEEQSAYFINGLMVIPVLGCLGNNNVCGTDYNNLTMNLLLARDNPLVQMVLLYIDSPGGDAIGAYELATLVAQVNAVKPCIAYSNGLCCSAAYYLASQCARIYCSPTAEIGCIGAIAVRYDCTGANQQQGIIANVFKHGELKDAFLPDVAMADDAKNLMAQEIQELGEQFVATVLSKRTIKPEYINGWSYPGYRAASLEYNYADGIIFNIYEIINYLLALMPATETQAV